MATNLLKFCMASSDGLALALAVGGSGVGYVSCVGKMYTWSMEGATGSEL